MLVATLVAAVIGPTGGCAGQAEHGECAQPPGCVEPVDVCCDEAHVCVERTCAGTAFVCSLAAGGRYEWIAGDALCDDHDPCTVGDRCEAGGCSGLPMICDSPPASVCNNRSAVHYRAPGTCADGVCQYRIEEVVCAQGCVDGRCLGEPCKGVICDSPPVCFEAPGVCADGVCEYRPSAAGTPCQPQASCATGTCDGKGTCEAAEVSCEAPHATGGTCVDGVCRGYVCDSGWGNCNSSWSDGCETPLDTKDNCGDCGARCNAPHADGQCGPGGCTFKCHSGWENCNGSWADGCEAYLQTSVDNCGACGRRCTAGPNSTASCVAGKCQLTCVAPYRDCNQNPADGCEIPVGVANVCDRLGLNSTDGCGTAYCGTATSTKAENFGTWTCTFCTHCHRWPDGYSWCLSTSGRFSSDRCASCCDPATEMDLVCPK